MSSETGTNSSPTSTSPFDSLEANFKRVVNYLMSMKSGEATAPNATPSDAASFTSKATRAVKQHPLAAIGVALGLGYLLMRLIRR